MSIFSTTCTCSPYVVGYTGFAQALNSLELKKLLNSRLWKPLNLKKYLERPWKIIFRLELFFVEIYCGSFYQSLLKLVNTILAIIVILLTKQNEGENHMEEFFCTCHDSPLHGTCGRTLKIGSFGLEKSWKTWIPSTFVCMNHDIYIILKTLLYLYFFHRSILVVFIYWPFNSV